MEICTNNTIIRHKQTQHLNQEMRRRRKKNTSMFWWFVGNGCVYAYHQNKIVPSVRSCFFFIHFSYIRFFSLVRTFLLKIELAGPCSLLTSIIYFSFGSVVKMYKIGNHCNSCRWIILFFSLVFACSPFRREYNWSRFPFL